MSLADAHRRGEMSSEAEPLSERPINGNRGSPSQFRWLSQQLACSTEVIYKIQEMDLGVPCCCIVSFIFMNSCLGIYNISTRIFRAASSTTTRLLLCLGFFQRLGIAWLVGTWIFKRRCECICILLVLNMDHYHRSIHYVHEYADVLETDMAR